MRRLFALTALVLSACAAPAQEILIRDITIVDAARNTLHPHMDVEVQGERITAVRPHRFWRGGSRTVDGQGRYLIPGLWDAHVHMNNLTEPAFPLLITLGITSVRDMGGEPAELASWRRRIEAGELVGPRLKFCGLMLEATDDFPVNRESHRVIRTPQEAREVVAEEAQLGVDCIKVRSVRDEETYRAIFAAAHEHGLPVAGHPPYGFDPVMALSLGPQTYEHIFYPYPFATLPEDQRAAILSAFVDSHVALTPTLVAWAPATTPITALQARYDALTHDAAAAQAISPLLLLSWADGLRYSIEEQRGSPGWVSAVRQAESDAATMAQAGVPVTAGTDLGAPFVAPETALYDELERLVAYMGLTPAQALLAATAQPARLFNQDGSMGAVEPGYVADLVILTADPLQDIANVRSVDTVITRGRVYDAQARAALREQVTAALRQAWAAEDATH
ncbi:MAG: amidohydrolase family protein [Hyphomonadaceae bacterium]